ncbi:hypothetical protein ELD05_13600 [Caldicellulosiruptor changbaiensis]|uniref:O-antigen ligase domain-containing protein n=1 Tax=Caldicellulosiruptor changbaiensis TaxID=1222016 RepID=A0A3T0D9T5_9FIRM|nr:hypothetical protein [Caldicellulosiruptor changbaiensis]AZT91542.1 hypothetical protein ELD05_13600 [Caldicellulosiruptor changbaiensis]
MERENNKVDCILLSILFLFVFAIPKSGFNIHNIPFYVGIIVVVIYIALNLKYYKPLVLIDLIPYWGFISLLIYLLMHDLNNKETVIRYILGFIVLPFLFNIIARKKLSIEDTLKVITIVGAIPVIYGVIQIMFGIENTVIPGLTANYTQLKNFNFDVYKLLTAKCNRVGEYYKLISTYQNGNMFGIFLVLYYPLLLYWEKTKLRNISYLLQSLTIICIFRSLSRTAIIAFVMLIVVLNFVRIVFKKFNITIKEFIHKTTLTIVIFIVLSTISKEELIKPIIMRLFNNKSEEIITMNNRITPGLLNSPSLGNLLLGNPNFGHESLYAEVLFSLGILIGSLFLFTLLFIDYKLVKILKSKNSSELYGVFILSFLSVQIAAISDIAWGLFPIESQFWIIYALNIIILSQSNIDISSVKLQGVFSFIKQIIFKTLTKNNT